MEIGSSVIGKPYVGQTGHYSYVNEFGRDSLRIILDHLQHKRFIIPDFCCPIVYELFNTMHINYKFYRVNMDGSSKISDIPEDSYDVVYAIQWNKDDVLKVKDGKILVADCVFQRDFKVSTILFFGFNSWRKCTPLTAGSMIKASSPLRDSYYRLPPSQFDLLLSGKYTTYSHFMVKNRDEIQEDLAEKQIYLPVFWRGTPNQLSDHIISVPMDDRYTEEQINDVKEFLWKHRL